jgi:hypothetical protein
MRRAIGCAIPQGIRRRSPHRVPPRERLPSPPHGPDHRQRQVGPVPGHRPRLGCLPHPRCGDHVGGTIRHGERIITIDDLLVSPSFIANIDEAMNHYDVRSIYSGEIGEALGSCLRPQRGPHGDHQRSRRCRGHRPPGGAQQTDAGFATDGTKLWQGTFNAGVTLDQNDIPQGDRYGFFRSGAVCPRGHVREADQPGPQRPTGSIARAARSSASTTSSSSRPTTCRAPMTAPTSTSRPTAATTTR